MWPAEHRGLWSIKNFEIMNTVVCLLLNMCTHLPYINLGFNCNSFIVKLLIDVKADPQATIHNYVSFNEGMRMWCRFKALFLKINQGPTVP